MVNLVSVSRAGTAPVGVRRSATYLPEIESLRGVAMLLVYLFHLNSHLAGPPRDPAERIVSPLFAFVAAGHTGVGLFFVLSGFLLSLPFLAEAAGGKRVDRWHYFQRRALRILPLYYTAVVVGTLLCASAAADLWRGVPYLLFLNSIGNWSTPLWPYSNVWWSLATEAQYYVLLPLLPLCVRSRAGRVVGALVLFGYVAAYGLFLAGFNMLSIPNYLALKLSVFGRGPLFLCGIAVAWIYQHHGARIRDRLALMGWLRAGGADVALLVVVTLLGFLLQWQHRRLYDNPPYFAWHLLEGMLWATILGLVLLAPLRFKALLTNRVLGTLGILSYSIYLCHVPMIYWVLRVYHQAGGRWQASWNARTAALAIVITICSVGFSLVTYRWIERPFLQRKARVE